MQPKDLAIMLNVSQSQIIRNLQEKTRPTEYELICWKREMRLAEMYIRQLTEVLNASIYSNPDRVEK